MSEFPHEGMRYLPICEQCIAGEGSECHTPECALFLRDVPSDGLIAEFALASAAPALDAVKAEAESGLRRRIQALYDEWESTGPGQQSTRDLLFDLGALLDSTARGSRTTDETEA